MSEEQTQEVVRDIVLAELSLQKKLKKLLHSTGIQPRPVRTGMKPRVGNTTAKGPPEER